MVSILFSFFKLVKFLLVDKSRKETKGKVSFVEKNQEKKPKVNKKHMKSKELKIINQMKKLQLINVKNFKRNLANKP